MALAIRPALAVDVAAIRAIYGHAVQATVATFDLENPEPEYWLDKIGRQGDGDHVLVAAEGGAVVGFAYSGPFRPRPAYALTRETSVYVAPGELGRGVGRTLYEALLARLRADGMHLAVAVVALPNPASVALHEHTGFAEVGTVREIGRKFGRWVDTRWYQRVLDPVSSTGAG